MRGVTAFRSLTVTLVLSLVLIGSMSESMGLVLAQEGTPVTEGQVQEPPMDDAPVELPPVELPTETPVPPPTEVPPPPPTDVPALEPTVAEEVLATETPVDPILEPTLEMSATIEPSATATEAVLPAAMTTGTVVVRIHDWDGSLYVEPYSVWFEGRSAGSVDDGTQPYLTTTSTGTLTVTLPVGSYFARTWVHSEPIEVMAGQTVTLDLYVEEWRSPKGSVRFNVTSSDGSAIEWPEFCFIERGCTDQEGWAGASGNWRMAVGTHALYVRADGYHMQATSVTVVKDGESTVNVQLEPLGIAGRGRLVVNAWTADGAPIPEGYSLWVDSPFDMDALYQGEPQEVSFSDLKPGWYTAWLSYYSTIITIGHGYPGQIKTSVYVKAGDTSYATLVLPAVEYGTVTFVLNSDPGFNSQDWEVSLVSIDGKAVNWANFYDNTARLTGTPAGTYRYEIYYSSYTSTQDRPGVIGEITVTGSEMTVPVSLPLSPEGFGTGDVEIAVRTSQGADADGGPFSIPVCRTTLTKNSFVDCERPLNGVATFEDQPEGPATYAIRSENGDSYSVTVNVRRGLTAHGTIEVPAVTFEQTGMLTFELFYEDGKPVTLGNYSVQLSGSRWWSDGALVLGSNTIPVVHLQPGPQFYTIFGDGSPLVSGIAQVVSQDNTVVRIELPLSTSQPTPPATATAAPSVTAMPSNTPSPTETLTPSRTPTRTATPTKTVTQIPTKTSTPTRTPTNTTTNTPTKTSTPTVIPTVAGIGTAATTSNVNCRASGSSSATSYGTVAKGTILTIRGAASNGWTPVICFGKSGWVSSSYLKVTPTVTPTATPTKTATNGGSSGTGVAKTAVNCRKTASTSGTIIGTVAKGTAVPLRGVVSGGWYPVVCLGQNGFISASYLTIGGVVPPSITPTRTATATSGGTRITTASVNCRQTGSSSGKVIVVLGKGVSVPVRGSDVSGWTPVVCGGQNGWVSSSYLRS